VFKEKDTRDEEKKQKQRKETVVGGLHGAARPAIARHNTHPNLTLQITK
jgi:hypothetical protein